MRNLRGQISQKLWTGLLQWNFEKLFFSMGVLSMLYHHIWMTLPLGLWVFNIDVSDVIYDVNERNIAKYTDKNTTYFSKCRSVTLKLFK